MADAAPLAEFMAMLRGAVRAGLRSLEGAQQALGGPEAQFDRA